MKIPPGVTVHGPGGPWREGEEWPDHIPVPDHLKDSSPPKPGKKE